MNKELEDAVKKERNIIDKINKGETINVLLVAPTKNRTKEAIDLTYAKMRASVPLMFNGDVNFLKMDNIDNSTIEGAIEILSTLSKVDVVCTLNCRWFTDCEILETIYFMANQYKIMSIELPVVLYATDIMERELNCKVCAVDYVEGC